MDNLPEYLDKYLDARFETIGSEIARLREALDREIAALREVVREGQANNARLVEMIQREVHDQNARITAMDGKIDARFSEMARDLKDSKRYYATTLLISLGVVVAILSWVITLAPK